MLKEEIKVKGEELLSKIKELVHEGNVRRITIKDDQGKVLLKFPLNLGVVGVLLAPFWAAVGTLAALIGNFTLTIERKESASTPAKTEEKAEPKKASKEAKPSE
ncbi:MAG: DUF4342 domain-containing protein [Spirochaetes bacterium]|nr:DUF4342 domain-containing protein [Spirochaetota bacterium]